MNLFQSHTFTGLPTGRCIMCQRFFADHAEPDDETIVAYDGFGTPLYAHQIPPEGLE